MILVTFVGLVLTIWGEYLQRYLTFGPNFEIRVLIC